MKSNLAIALLASATQAQQEFSVAQNLDYNMDRDAHHEREYANRLFHQDHQVVPQDHHVQNEYRPQQNRYPEENKGPEERKGKSPGPKGPKEEGKKQHA